jgi:hypothetical protein
MNEVQRDDPLNQEDLGEKPVDWNDTFAGP